MTQKEKILIGIDPGINNGVCLVIDSKIEVLVTLHFWQVIEVLSSFKKPNDNDMDVHVYLEYPNYNKPTFQKKGADTQAAVNKISQNVGGNKAYAHLIYTFCVKEGISVTRVKPTSKKLDAATFAKITKYTGRTSQHARDAAMLIYGR